MARLGGGNRSASQPKTFYLDASAMVKRYLAETGSAWVESLCAEETAHALAIAHIGVVEVAAAFAAKRRGNHVTADEYDSALASLTFIAADDDLLAAAEAEGLAAANPNKHPEAASL